MANSTYLGYLSEVSKLRKFKGAITFTEFNRQMILHYEQYMLGTLRNKQNTVNRTFRRIKSFLRQARIMGLLSHDPFIGYRMSHAPTSREALNWEEMEKIEKLQHSQLKDNQMNVLRGFLFACYTGLRFIDVRRLEMSHIVNGVIVMQMSKTGAVVRIPISKKAAALISEGDCHLFRLYKNYETNLLVKSLMVAAGISRKVTFHISRHTFATLSLNMGISMEVVSGLLGRANLKTTQIYAKILDNTRVEMMKKLDEITPVANSKTD